MRIQFQNKLHKKKYFEIQRRIKCKKFFLYYICKLSRTGGMYLQKKNSISYAKKFVLFNIEKVSIFFSSMSSSLLAYTRYVCKGKDWCRRKGAKDKRKEEQCYTYIRNRKKTFLFLRINFSFRLEMFLLRGTINPFKYN